MSSPQSPRPRPVPRRRIYLLRHAEVSYVSASGRLVRPDEAILTARGAAQATALAELFRPVKFDRAITSGLPRTIDTAQRVLADRPDAPQIESWPELAEARSGRLRDIAPDALEAVFLGAFRGAAPESARLIGGESIGELFNRVLPALQRLVDDRGWDCALMVAHGGINRVIISYALTGGRTFLGHIEQAPACVNVLDVGDNWIVRALNFRLDDPLHTEGRATTMEQLLEQLRPFLPR